MEIRQARADAEADAPHPEAASDERAAEQGRTEQAHGNDDDLVGQTKADAEHQQPEAACRTAPGSSPKIARGTRILHN
jgi:hypothetical protein